MDRRTLLRLAAFAGLQFISSKLFAQTRCVRKAEVGFEHLNSDVIVDQSGNFGQGHFVVGILSCSDTKAAVKAIQSLRNKSNFCCRLRYTSRNKWKAKYAKDLIDYWLDSSSMYIRIRAIKQTQRKAAEMSLDKDLRYVAQITSVLNARRRVNDTSRVVMQSRYRAKEKNADFIQRVIKGSKQIRGIVPIKENQSDLVQLLGFIVGTEVTRRPIISLPTKPNGN